MEKGARHLSARMASIGSTPHPHNASMTYLGPAPGTAELQLDTIAKKVAPGEGAKKEEFDRGRRIFAAEPSDSRASLAGP